MSDTALVIMARYPEKGTLKTRLARSIGEDGTLRLYQAFLTDLAQRFADGPYDLCWAYTPPESDFQTFAARLAPARSTTVIRYIPQQGSNFGTRLHQVFYATQKLDFQRTVIISSDSPQISKETILQAYTALDNADVVLGPAEDGGYYLIGMREPYDLFSGIPMSTEVVLQMTLEKVQKLDLSFQLLEPLFDVDEQTELVRLAQLLQQKPELATHTAACLEELKIVLP